MINDLLHIGFGLALHGRVIEHANLKNPPSFKYMLDFVGYWAPYKADPESSHCPTNPSNSWPSLLQLRVASSPIVITGHKN